MANNSQVIKAIERKLVTGMTHAVEASNRLLAKAIEIKCPVDKGVLKASIDPSAVEVKGDSISASVEVGTKKGFPYVLAEEYGTYKSPAKPFIRPAAIETEERRKRLLVEAARKAFG
jgi:HK97 gp10 family phage protein